MTAQFWTIDDQTNSWPKYAAILYFSRVVQDFKSSPAQVRPLRLGRSRLRNLIFYIFLLLVRPNKTNLDSFNTFRKYQNLAFQDMFLSSCKTRREIGSSHLGAVQFALTNKSTSNMFGTQSPSRRIGCEGLRMSMARAGQRASVTAVPLVSSDATRLYLVTQENEYSISDGTRKIFAWENPA